MLFFASLFVYLSKAASSLCSCRIVNWFDISCLQPEEKLSLKKPNNNSGGMCSFWEVTSFPCASWLFISFLFYSPWADSALRRRVSPSHSARSEVSCWSEGRWDFIDSGVKYPVIVCAGLHTKTWPSKHRSPYKSSWSSVWRENRHTVSFSASTK